MSTPGVPILPGFENIFILLLSFFVGTVFSGALVDGEGSVGRSIPELGGRGGCGIACGMFMAAVAWKTAVAVAPTMPLLPALLIIELASGGEVGEGSVADRFRMEDCIAHAPGSGCLGRGWEGGGAGIVDVNGCISVGSKKPGPAWGRVVVCCCWWCACDIAALGEVRMPAESGGGAVVAEEREGGRGVLGGTSLMVEVEALGKFVKARRLEPPAEDDADEVDETEGERPCDEAAAGIGGTGGSPGEEGWVR